MKRVVLICSILLSTVSMAVAAPPDEYSAAVDKLFAQWNSPKTPGATVAIISKGRPVYVHSYGMANVELADKNSPDVIYPIGSLSKQFTGFCIQLLAHDGKLSLQDDIRKYVPEMHDFGQKITLEMLLHHTSGLRESVSLLNLMGYGPEDVTTTRQALDLLFRQKMLNFPAGSRYLYSNSNYILLGLVVERVSGMKLGEFLQERIFRPLGMDHTTVTADPMGITERRAYGYGKNEDGRYVPRMSSDSILGPSGILSTIGDLEKWDANFYDAHVGGRAVIDAMLKTGTLSDQTPITYASGLHEEHFHGLSFVEHSGYIWGFKSDLLRFPEQHISIIVLTNTDGCDAPEKAFPIAQIYLKQFFRKPPPKPAPVEVAPSLIEQYLGTYEIAAGTTLRAPGRQIVFRREDFIGEKAELAASSETDFFSKKSDFRVTFVPGASGGPAKRAIIHEPSGDDFVARRVNPAQPQHPLPEGDRGDQDVYTGQFYSDELDVLYTVSLHEGKLWMRYPRGEIELNHESEDAFLWKIEPTETIQFTHDKKGAVDGFLLTEKGQRIQNLQFVKVRLEEKY